MREAKPHYGGFDDWQSACRALLVSTAPGMPVLLALGFPNWLLRWSGWFHAARNGAGQSVAFVGKRLSLCLQPMLKIHSVRPALFFPDTVSRLSKRLFVHFDLPLSASSARLVVSHWPWLRPVKGHRWFKAFGPVRSSTSVTSRCVLRVQC